MRQTSCLGKSLKGLVSVGGINEKISGELMCYHQVALNEEKSHMQPARRNLSLPFNGVSLKAMG